MQAGITEVTVSLRAQVVLIKVVVSIGRHVKHFDCSGPVVRTRCAHDNQLLENAIEIHSKRHQVFNRLEQLKKVRF